MISNLTVIQAACQCQILRICDRFLVDFAAPGVVYEYDSSRIVGVFDQPEGLKLIVHVDLAHANCILDRELPMKGVECDSRRLQGDGHLVVASQRYWVTGLRIPT